jgi:hypothetical protein
MPSPPDIKSDKTPTLAQPHPVAPVNGYGRGLAAGQISKREKYLRRAAFYAADSLSMSDKLGVTFADFTSRELPVQSAMCSFDCAQVLAEWVAVVQERVGPYMGILGKDNIDFDAVPACMMLEQEDIKLFEKIGEVLRSAELKLNYEYGGSGGQSSGDCGYGGKILRVTASMLDKAAVWPLLHIMAQALRSQAEHMEARARSSLSNRE